MVKRMVDERKTADGIKQATHHKDWRRYVSHGHRDLPNGEQFDDLLDRLDDAEIAQAADPLGRPSDLLSYQRETLRSTCQAEVLGHQKSKGWRVKNWRVRDENTSLLS
jgi:hypothetical protein